MKLEYLYIIHCSFVIYTTSLLSSMNSGIEAEHSSCQIRTTPKASHRKLIAVQDF
jgi:hypothetical protein